MRIHRQSAAEASSFTPSRPPLAERLSKRRRLTAGAAVVLLLLVAAGAASGQSSENEALRKRIQALEERQRALEAQVAELQRRLGDGAARPAAPSAAASPPPALMQTVNIAGAPFKGKTDAPVTIVEFSDYQCGFCGRHARQTLPLLDKEFVQTGRVKYVFRSFPNEATHKLAPKAHEAASCAGEQGNYWGMHDLLFATPDALQPANLPRHASALGLAMPRFTQCLESSRYLEQTRKDAAQGRALGVSGSPTFFLGVATGSGDQVTVLRTIRGAKPFQVFKDTIEQLLASRR